MGKKKGKGGGGGGGGQQQQGQQSGEQPQQQGQQQQTQQQQQQQQAQRQQQQQAQRQQQPQPQQKPQQPQPQPGPGGDFPGLGARGGRPDFPDLGGGGRGGRGGRGGGPWGQPQDSQQDQESYGRRGQGQRGRGFHSTGRGRGEEANRAPFQQPQHQDNRFNEPFQQPQHQDNRFIEPFQHPQHQDYRFNDPLPQSQYQGAGGPPGFGEQGRGRGDGRSHRGRGKGRGEEQAYRQPAQEPPPQFHTPHQPPPQMPQQAQQQWRTPSEASSGAGGPPGFGEQGRGRGDGRSHRGRGKGRGEEQAYRQPAQEPPPQFTPHQPPPQMPQQAQQQWRTPSEASSGATGPSPPSSVYSDDGDRGGRGRGERGRGRGRGKGRGAQDDRQGPPQGYTTPEPVQSPPQPQPQPQQPKSTLKSPQEEQLASAVSKIKLSPSSTGKGLWQIPYRKRKGDVDGRVGTRGRPIVVEVNHLRLTLKKQHLAVHYDCAFKPDVPKKMLRSAIGEMQKKHFPSRYPAFDGRKNLYSAGPLPFGDTIRDTVLVADEERGKPKEFDVTIKQVSMVDMSQIAQYLTNGVGFPQDAIQALDIVLRNPAAMRFTNVGRSYFTRPKNQIIDLGNGLELWYGFYQSAVLGWRPYLNVDVAHKGFPEPKSLLEVMLDMKAKYGRFNDPRPTLESLNRGLGRNELDDFNKFIKGLKVEYMIPNQPNTRRVYKMNGTKQPCNQHRFKLDDGRMITIGEYYEREKRYRLRFPSLPSIHVGSTTRDVCIPPELCQVTPGQVMNKKMDETQTAAMVKAAARPTDERKARIKQAMRDAGFNQDKCINEFGVSVNEEFERVNARILDAPKLEYRGNQVIKAMKGVWRAGQFLESHRLDNWVVMTLAPRGNSNQLRDFARTMSQQGRQVGMNISEPYKYIALSEEGNAQYRTGDQLKQTILPYFKRFKEEKAQLVVVVIPDRPPDSYSKVKLAAEVEVGLLTQCIKERTMFKMNPATAGNILLKVNAKLNGTNHTVDRSFCPQLMDAPTMLVGADVTHPSPDQTTIPSVAAVAASHDRRAFRYNMVWRLQPPREEIIVDLQEIMRTQLIFFYKQTHQKPLRILFYRDGVSEGQFSQVLDREMTAIRRACSSLQADYQPKVTFLVVQKRHHTRFFPTRKEDEDGRNKNVPAGTIVDTMITHPKEMDFYLVSHASLQGTSRPTKYHKLWDENDIDEDDLEEMTYYLCHLFSRCTRSVSYPAPTYYAHLAASRGRVYLEGSSINLTNLDQEMRNRTISSIIVNESPMFFV